MHNHAAELTIGLSFLLGTLHSLEPGHGKTAMFLYLLGGRRSMWHPVVIGLSTAVSHSVSLFAIAFAVHLTHHLVTGDHHHEETVSSILQWVSAGLVLGVGAYLLVQAIRGKTQTCCHHDHNYGAGHVHSTGHEKCVHHEHHVPADEPVQLTLPGKPLASIHCSHHEPEIVAPTEPARGGFKATALLGLAVGLFPCPSALAAYFAGLSSGSPGTAYLIITLFAAGMACSLTTVGIVLQYFGDRVGGRLQGTSRIPWAHIRAVLIMGIGAFYLARLGMA